MITTILNIQAPKPNLSMPALDNSIFNQELSRTQGSVGAVVSAAAKAGRNGIKDHPCEKSPAPGCVSP
jgi:hypothetical protein